MLEIVIFILPTELSELRTTIKRLRESAKLLSATQQHRINVIMGVSNEIVDWSRSEWTKQQCKEEFEDISKLVDWTESQFTVSTTINGCTTARKHKAFDTDAKWYLWLDVDIIFPEETLHTTFNSIEVIEEAGFNKFVLTPSTVRLWDATWDCIVSPRFLDKPLGYERQNNPYEDTVLSNINEFTLSEVRNSSSGQPYMKFAGGWFTVISHDLLTIVPIPDSFSHYGLEDTYIMWGTHVLNDPNIKQFRNEELVVCENYFDRDVYLKNKIKLIDRRDEYKNHNTQMFNIELNNLLRGYNANRL
jgi:hypothetical protein